VRLLSVSVIVFCFSWSLSAQSGVGVVGAGYIGPNNSIQVAPGQITTFFLSGVNTALPAPGRIDATKLPLPTSLGGFSATIQQTLNNASFNLPILSVKQTNVCASGASIFTTPDCTITSLTVQIPNGITVPNPLSMSPVQFGVTELVVSVNGSASRSFSLGPVSTNIHMLTNCDGSPVANYGGLPCSWLITHADGSLVSTFAPAKPGETVVAYAFGFGEPSVPLQDGYPAPKGATLAPDQFQLSYAYRVNGPAPPIEMPILQRLPDHPVYAGLVSGFVGLYQMNFVVPFPPFGMLPCDGRNVFSNVTVTVQGFQSSDNASFCVGSGLPIPLG
jgi:uncharacterized protein (TIGR03437 family)